MVTIMRLVHIIDEGRDNDEDIKDDGDDENVGSCMLANKLGNYPGNRPLITPIIPHPVGHIIRYNEDNKNDCESFNDFLFLIILIVLFMITCMMMMLIMLFRIVMIANERIFLQCNVLRLQNRHSIFLIP